MNTNSFPQPIITSSQIIIALTRNSSTPVQNTLFETLSVGWRIWFDFSGSIQLSSGSLIWFESRFGSLGSNRANLALGLNLVHWFGSNLVLGHLGRMGQTCVWVKSGFGSHAPQRSGSNLGLIWLLNNWQVRWHEVWVNFGFDLVVEQSMVVSDDVQRSVRAEVQ